LYLQGRFYWNKRTPESLRRAVDYFAQAIVRDPNYARAYVGLADCYNLLREFSAMPANEAYPKALDAARRAVQLDDASADAHNSLAFVSFYWNWDAAQADREFRRAIQLNPNYVLAHHWRANFLMTVGRLPEALDEIEEARKLDPTSNATLADKGLLLFRMRRFGEALTLLQQIEAQEPRFSSSHFYLTVVHLERKDYPAFLAELREAYTLTQDSQGLAIVAAGEKGLAAGAYRGMFEGMLDVERQLYVKDQLPAYALAQTCGRLGRKAETLSYLRTSLERLEPAMVTLRVDEALDFVRGDAAYQEIVRRFDLGAHR
jgi:tetratricopeptide (TPR) repeat protein